MEFELYPSPKNEIILDRFIDLWKLTYSLYNESKKMLINDSKLQKDYADFTQKIGQTYELRHINKDNVYSLLNQLINYFVDTRNSYYKNEKCHKDIKEQAIHLYKQITIFDFPSITSKKIYNF